MARLAVSAETGTCLRQASVDMATPILWGRDVVDSPVRRQTTAVAVTVALWLSNRRRLFDRNSWVVVKGQELSENRSWRLGPSLAI